MRQLIWKNKNRLKGSNTFVTESYPAEIKYWRKILWPYVNVHDKQWDGKKLFLELTNYSSMANLIHMTNWRAFHTCTVSQVILRKTLFCSSLEILLSAIIMSANSK